MTGRHILWCAALAACGGSSGTPPPTGPIVDSLAPETGPWGTEVTIDGAHFGSVAGSSVVAFQGQVGANGFVVDTWNDSEITGRIAFPATGDLFVQTAGGQADAGTFTTTTTWTPSSALDVAQLVDARVLSTGSVAALYRSYELSSEPALAVFGGAAAGTYPLDGLVDPNNAMSPLVARVVDRGDGTPVVIATKQDGTVAELVPQAGSVVATATGLTGAVVAAGVDTTGLYAWVDTTSGLVRARAGSPWAVDRGPIAAPFAPLDAAIAADGTLWIAISEPAQGNAAFISVQTLAPDATQLPAPERVDPTSHAGAITQAQLTLAGDGTHALVAATSTDSGTSTTLSPRLRTAAATWSDAPAVTGLVQYAFVGATLAALVNDPQGKTTSLLADATMPASAQVIPVWPMQSVGIVSDGTKVYPLIGNGSVTYALTPP